MPGLSAEAFGDGDQLRLGQEHDMAAVVIQYGMTYVLILYQILNVAIWSVFHRRDGQVIESTAW